MDDRLAGDGTRAVTGLTVVIPTLNASHHLDAFLPALAAQALNPHQVLVLDSESSDDTVAQFRKFGAEVKVIDRATFGHGRTRQLAVDMRPDSDIFVFLTQDAVLASANAISLLIASFNAADIGIAYGRQLPRPNAGPSESFARLYNYPEQSDERSYDSKDRLGIRAAFCSNSFAAYRAAVLTKVGGFPIDAHFGEDQAVTAKALVCGWNVAYVAEAAVYHSHGYTIVQEFRRYFDIGSFHFRHRDIFEPFGGPSGQGVKYALAEVAHLAKHHPAATPGAVMRSLAKYLGYQLGRHERWIHSSLKPRLSLLPRHVWDA